MAKELLSRFRVLYLPPYSQEEFMHAAVKVLVARGRVDPDLASYIAQRAWQVSRNVREAVRMGQICQCREEVDEDISLMQKYGIK